MTADARALIERVRERHAPYDNSRICIECSLDDAWPCPPAQLADALEQALGRLDAARYNAKAEATLRRDHEAHLVAQGKTVLRLEAERDEARAALLRSNDLLRSCHAVAEREGCATNWPPLQRQLLKELEAQHALTNRIRAALAEEARDV